MKTIYTIAQEINDNGFYNSDKTFTNIQSAIKYLRMVVSKDIRSEKRHGAEIKYLNVYKPNIKDISFPQTIEYGYKNGDEWMRIDIRVKSIILFDNEEEFNKYPIQL